MSIKIGHASADERRKASGGKAGDQTGGEVCVRTWYSSPWDCVLRPKSPEVAEASARAMEAACTNPHIGYDQSARNTLYNYALAAKFDLAAIEDNCECDCSSLVHVCVIAAGVPLTYSVNGHTTWTIAAALVGSGAYEKLTEDKYLASDAFLKRGDILLNTDAHVAMALENGAGVREESEAARRGHLAPSSETPSSRPTTVLAIQPTVGTVMLTPLPLLKKGSEGLAVWAMQVLLKAWDCDCGEADGIFGAQTEAALLDYQRKWGLEPDGECGKMSWAMLINGGNANG